MKKDRVCDYATTAFALYAKYGRRSEEELRDYIYHRELLRNDRPDIAVKKAEAAVAESTALFDDISAVCRTLELLKRCGDPDRLRAVELVYVTDEGSTRRDIGDRVRAVSHKIPATERTIYRWLKEARTVFAEFRGLYKQE